MLSNEPVTSVLATEDRLADAHFDVLAPISDSATYIMLASEVARIASSSALGEVTVITDARTASQTDALDNLRSSVHRIYLSGTPPYAWPASANVVHAGVPTDVPFSQFLVVLSPTIGFAVLGKGAIAPEATWGYWSAERDYVESTALALFQGMKIAPSEKVLKRDPGYPTVTLSAVMHLMGVHTRQNALRQRDMAMDKDDLLSVLNILKAISAQRRAHDILFVFVERIAQVIKVDRCSVVRIWGDDNVGHVLASHEDESVYDLVLELNKYPEIRQSLSTREKVVINDVSHDPLTRKFGKELRAAKVAALLVIPIGLFDENNGSLFLRAARSSEGFGLREVSFCEIVAEAASNALERGHLFESIQRANERLAHLAVTDGLTGLYNHRFFRERIQEEVERARRYSQPLSCMIFDIDNFKKINDTYGHLQGDAILREMANCTAATVRKSDIVARYGGEEFVVIMPQTDIVGATANADRLITALRAQVHRGFPPGFKATVSIGVAIFEHETMLEAESLIRLADGALYEAKRTGKDRVVVATSQGETV